MTDRWSRKTYEIKGETDAEKDADVEKTVGQVEANAAVEKVRVLAVYLDARELVLDVLFKTTEARLWNDDRATVRLDSLVYEGSPVWAVVVEGPQWATGERVAFAVADLDLDENEGDEAPVERLTWYDNENGRRSWTNLPDGRFATVYFDRRFNTFGASVADRPGAAPEDFSPAPDLESAKRIVERKA